VRYIPLSEGQDEFQEIVDGLTRYGTLAEGIMPMLREIEMLNDDARNDRVIATDSLQRLHRLINCFSTLHARPR